MICQVMRLRAVAVFYISKILYSPCELSLLGFLQPMALGTIKTVVPIVGGIK